ncbi:hypothetical protein F4604DRAFT_2043166 [Suillus subluteus]|nr:hypothetical protein F4604DRAFT_2043166 [Suillus subluteus]
MTRVDHGALTFLHFCTNLHNRSPTFRAYWSGIFHSPAFTYTLLPICPLSVIYNITIVSWRNSVRQHVSRATYYHHAKYHAPKASVFDKTLTTLIQANSANSSSVQLNDSDTDVQPAHQHTLKRRHIDSGTHALSDDNQIIPAGDALQECNDVPQVHLDVFEHYNKQIIPAGDALEERNDVPQVRLDVFEHYDNAFPGLDDLDVHAGQDDSDGYAGQDDTSEL